MDVQEVRTGICARLRGRREEIVRDALARVRAVADPRQVAAADYVQGLHVAVTVAIDYGITALERSEDRAPPIPAELLSQARRAARSGIPIETVLRRYLAGYTLLGDFVNEEVQRSGIPAGDPLKRLLQVQARVFDRVVALIAEEYRRESETHFKTPSQRRGEKVMRLLEGSVSDVSALAYEFDGWHLGLVGTGPGIEELLRERMGQIDCQTLVVGRPDQSAWLWLGSRSPIETEDALARFDDAAERALSLAAGEPAQALSGWRLTHRQAQAALPVVSRGSGSVARYADVALVASALQDGLLASSLKQIYLAPLEEEQDRGATARAILRAYFSADRSISSAAAALGINRHTVAKRLHTIEETLGRTLSSCSAELETALRLDQIA